MFQKKSSKINQTFPRKSCRLLDNVEKYTKARQATDYSIIWHRQDAIFIPDNKGKNTETHS